MLRRTKLQPGCPQKARKLKRLSVFMLPATQAACYLAGLNFFPFVYEFHLPISYATFGAIMAVERTLSIIKPDGVRKNVIGQILARFEKAGLKVVGAKLKQLSQAEAEGFYAVHRERGFFADLVKFMISGPVMIQVLEGEGAILINRDLMGATDPKKAEAGTIRADFAESIDANAVHGSDAAETAAVEIAYFFAGTELSR